MAAHGLDGLLYGHFGDGCIHARIDFPLRDRPSVLRSFTAGRGAAGRLLRRVGVRRARRRPGPRRAAAGHVLGDRDRPVRRGQAAVRPGQPAQSGRDRRSGPARRRPAGPAGGAAAARPRLRLRRRRRRLHGRRAPLHRRRQVPGRQHRLRRRHVPVLPGDPGREGLHQGPRAGAAGARERLAGVVGLAVARGRGGARPVPVLQGLLDRLPGRGGHGHLQGRGAVPAVPGQAPARVALRARLAAPLGGADVADTVDRQAGQRRPAVRARRRRWPSASAASTSAGTCPYSRPRASAAGSRSAAERPRHGPPASPTPARPCCCGWTRSPTPSRRRSARPRSRSSRRPATRCAITEAQRLLRPHLDLDRPAGRGQAAAEADARRTRPGPRRGHPGRRARAVVHRRAPRRRGRTAA